ncbi:phage baseplate assembly protein [Brucella pseudogrignonensis]|uniref:Phage baseplate assembly protein n=1 Tax=Brucella pseudogrignonensis TaxID=419475 RepID=A0A7Y3T7T3_9HYPH|nr:baseplate J/gp47 family protein [Brucella pseudogrignonensis]MCM0751199.1 phage baseplate assembly protein [Brucella pseudogrignonensis]NNV22642.1 phage baseplate assembly protein [Brucella pseudogrignonensis]
MADPVKRTLEQLRANGAPDFFERDPSKLKALFKQVFEDVSGRTLYPAQTEMFLIEVASYALSILHEAAQTATLQNTAVFADGVHLENRGTNVSTFRLLAQPATTDIRFELTQVRLIDVAVPKGTRVASGTAVIFATDADLIIPAGMTAGVVRATAQTPGAAFNGLGVGAVSDLLDPVAYVASARNVTTIAGGSDDEELERFRLRVVNALFTIAKTGPRNGYREHVMAVDPEIVDVAPIRPEPGYIHIYPLMKTGQPSVALKDAVLAYLDPDTLRAMGDYVTIHDPVRVGFSFTLTVRSLEAIAGLEDLVRATAEAAFHPWTQELGAQVAPSVIVAAVKALSGVSDVDLDGLEFTDLPETHYAGLDELTIVLEVRANV